MHEIDRKSKGDVLRYYKNIVTNRQLYRRDSDYER